MNDRGWAAQIPESEEFKRLGHVLVRGLITKDEVTWLRRSLPSSNICCVPDRGLERHVRLSWRSKVIRQFVLDRRFGAVAESLLDVSGVRLYQDTFLRKRPGTLATPWHNDATYWPHDGPGLTMWLALVDLPVDSGLLSFVSLENSRHATGYHELKAESDGIVSDLIAHGGWVVETNGPMRAGDATFHHGMTLHRAGANMWEIERDVFTVIYYADGARIADVPTAEQRPDLGLFPGCTPGSDAVTFRHPLIHQRCFEKALS